MAYSKIYQRINWVNKSEGTTTPLGAKHLNEIDYAADELDNRTIELETTKLDKATAQTLVKDITYDDSNGVILITYLSGATTKIDTKLEKIAVNFAFDEETQKLVLTLDDGTKQEIDLSALITQYEFVDSETMAFSLDSDGKVSAIVKEGSIGEKHLQPNYLADIKVQAANAQYSADAAAVSEANAKASEANAKTYAEQAKTVSGEQVALNRQTLGYSKKNLLKNTAVSSTSYGITFTVNDDGSVTANGTATEQARLYFKSNLVFNEDTILSIEGTTNGGVSGWYSGGNVFGSEKTVPAGTSYGEFFIFVNAGVTVNNVTVYPMIRSAEITDGTYEPYVDDVDTRFKDIYKNCLPISHPVAEGSFSMGRAKGSAVGENSTALGKGNAASGLGATAIGLYNTVSGNGSFATGMQNNVSGLYAEAFGQNNKVAGRSAHAEGLSNYASSENQHVQGRYNVKDTAGKYAHIVGNGSSDGTRSNAHTVDWRGNAWFAGDVEATDINGDIVSLCDCIKLVETGIITGESVMIDLKSDASYLLVTREITVSTGKIYGHRARMICTPKDFVATPSAGNLVASTNAGVTFANVNDGTNYGITLTATSTYEVSYSLYEFANTYGDYYYNVTG